MRKNGKVIDPVNRLKFNLNRTRDLFLPHILMLKLQFVNGNYSENL